MIVETQVVRFDSLPLDCGVTLAPVDVAYETYGELNSTRSNAILILHAFSGDAHAAGISHEGGKPGWWDNMIGPGKAFDTTQYFVICTNVLGGCRGTTGPASINPATRRVRTACRFPSSRSPTWCGCRRSWWTISGFSGCWRSRADRWAACRCWSGLWRIPEAVACAIPIATTSRHSAQQIAFNEVGRQAIMADPDWCDGNYYDKKPPARGLSVARMVGHITYMSDDSMREKFGRRFRTQEPLPDFSSVFEVESYLRYRGSQFVDRFDANSYLYITKAMDLFDVTNGHGSLAAALERTQSRFLVISFTSDWLYPTYQSLEIVSALRGRNRDVAFCELQSNYGHDAFLVDVAEQTELIRGFLASTYREKVARAS